MKLSHIQLISLLITLIITILPGVIAARKVKSADDYSIGGRKAGTAMVSGAILGTMIGGAATIGTAQLGFTVGLSAWWFTLGSGIALFTMAIFYSKPLRDSKLTTISEFLVINYGKGAGPVASISSTAGIFFSVVASTLTAIHLVAAVFNLSLVSSAITMVIIVAAFVFFGGISGSGLSGLFKIILIVASIFAGSIYAFNDMGGLEGMHQAFPEDFWFSLVGGGMQKTLYTFFSMIIGVISTQTYIQALFSAKDSKTAQVGCMTAALITIPIGLPSVVIGMYMKLHHPEMTAIEALPMFLLTYLPDWLGGIGIAALLLSAIGSMAGLSLGIATMIANDIFGAIIGIADSKKLLWINRICVILATVGAIVFVFHHLNSLVLEWNYLSMALRGAGIFLPLSFAVFAKGKVPPKIGFLAMLIGVVVALGWKLIVPTAQNTLFPSLAFNLIFLVPGLLYGILKKDSNVERS